MSLPEILALKIHIVVAVAETDFFFFFEAFHWPLRKGILLLWSIFVQFDICKKQRKQE